MIKKTVTYKDLTGMMRTEEFWFHVKKSELIDNQDLAQEFESMGHMLQGDGSKRELNQYEVKQILELVKRMVRLSYGERSEDGLRHRKSPEIWENFYSSEAYDAVLFSLFENPEEGMQFLTAVIPKDLLEQAEKEIAERGRKVPQDHQQKQVASRPEVTSVPGVETDSTFTDEEDDAQGPSESKEESPAAKRERLQRELAQLDVSDQPQH